MNQTLVETSWTVKILKAGEEFRIRLYRLKTVIVVINVVDILRVFVVILLRRGSPFTRMGEMVTVLFLIVHEYNFIGLGPKQLVQHLAASVV